MVVVGQLAAETVTWWWVTLAAGAVVLVVLLALLTALARVVEDIERELGRIWTAGKQVAGHTATTWLLEATATSFEALDRELDAVTADEGGSR